MTSTSDSTILSKEFGEVRQNFVELFEKKGEDTLARIVERSTASTLSNEDKIDAWKEVYPDVRAELETLMDEIERLQDEGFEDYDPNKYFVSNGNGGTKFVANRLAKDIEEDYEFRHLADSGQLFVYRDGYFQPRGEQVVKEEVNKRLGDEFIRRRMKNVVTIIETRKHVERHEFQPPTGMVNLKNGVYDLEKEELLPHSPDYNFAHKIPVEYDEEKTECPEIDKFLSSIVKSDETVRTLKEIAGYTMYPDYPINKAFVFVGQGNNGKSRFIDLLKCFIGEKNYTNKSLHELEENKFAKQKLYGRLACFDDDLPSDKIRNTNQLKKLTGGSDVGAEIKYGGQFDFQNYAKLLFATNEVPRTTDNSDGFFRRWLIIDFPFQFKNNPDPDNELEKKAISKNKLMGAITQEDELQGFLFQALKALKDILENNDFTEAPTPQEARRKWKEYSTPLPQFISKFVSQGRTQSEAQRQASEGQSSISSYDYDYIRKDDLRRVLKVYCKNRSHRPPSKKDIKHALDESDLWYGTNRTRQEPGEGQTGIYSGLKIDLDVTELKGTVEYWQSLLTEGSDQSFHVFNEQSRLVVNNLGEVVKSFVNQHYGNDSVEVTELFERMSEEMDFGSVSEDDFVEKIQTLKHEGELFEPQSGYVQTL